MPVCHIRLAEINIRLEALDKRLFNAATAVFHPALHQKTAVWDINISLSNQTKFSQLNRIDFVDEDIGFGLQKDHNLFQFHFDIGAQFEVNIESGAIHGRIHPQAICFLEDMLYLCLSPLLRQSDVFLLHGFAAQRDNQTIILVGPSGCGKTTAGLALLIQGWRFLANDIVLLKHDAIMIHPTFDRIRVREGTPKLLGQPDAQLSFDSFLLGSTGGVTAVYFMELDATGETSVQPLPKAVALAKLCEASVDRWDSNWLPSHFAFLKRLCKETAVYQLTSGQNIHQLYKKLHPHQN
ncbi:MAG: hypothetical protein AAF490_12695 [Chloroflexota bacterium]